MTELSAATVPLPLLSLNPAAIEAGSIIKCDLFSSSSSPSSSAAFPSEIDLAVLLHRWASTFWQCTFSRDFDLQTYPITKVTKKSGQGSAQVLVVRMGIPEVDVRDCLRRSLNQKFMGKGPNFFWQVHQTGRCTTYTWGFVLFIVRMLQRQVPISWDRVRVTKVTVLTVKPVLDSNRDHPFRYLEIHIPGTNGPITTKSMRLHHEIARLSLSDGRQLLVDLSPAQFFPSLEQCSSHDIMPYVTTYGAPLSHLYDTLFATDTINYEADIKNKSFTLPCFARQFFWTQVTTVASHFDWCCDPTATDETLIRVYLSREFFRPRGK